MKKTRWIQFGIHWNCNFFIDVHEVIWNETLGNYSEKWYVVSFQILLLTFKPSLPHKNQNCIWKVQFKKTSVNDHHEGLPLLSNAFENLKWICVISGRMNNSHTTKNCSWFFREWFHNNMMCVSRVPLKNCILNPPNRQWNPLDICCSSAIQIEIIIMNFGMIVDSVFYFNSIWLARFFWCKNNNRKIEKIFQLKNNTPIDIWRMFPLRISFHYFVVSLLMSKKILSPIQKWKSKFENVFTLHVHRTYDFINWMKESINFVRKKTISTN